LVFGAVLDVSLIAAADVPGVTKDGISITVEPVSLSRPAAALCIDA
jgi:hypothetical protein